MPPDDRDHTEANEPVPVEWGTDPTESDAIPIVHPEPQPEPVFCRRCGETSEPVANCCPWCGAWLVGPRPRAAPVYSLNDDAEPENDWHTNVARESYVVSV
ncbi:MAG: hypothetical protein J0I06_17345, partial [Planctomycetes bacterium]|nr:hypothetical protein [Planctomycetota bacterium]